MSQLGGRGYISRTQRTVVASIVGQEPADNYTIWAKDVAKNLLVQLFNDNKKNDKAAKN